MCVHVNEWMDHHVWNKQCLLLLCFPPSKLTLLEWQLKNSFKLSVPSPISLLLYFSCPRNSALCLMWVVNILYLRLCLLLNFCFPSSPTWKGFYLFYLYKVSKCVSFNFKTLKCSAFHAGCVPVWFSQIHTTFMTCFITRIVSSAHTRIFFSRGWAIWNWQYSKFCIYKNGNFMWFNSIINFLKASYYVIKVFMFFLGAILCRQ